MPATLSGQKDLWSKGGSIVSGLYPVATLQSCQFGAFKQWRAASSGSR